MWSGSWPDRGKVVNEVGTGTARSGSGGRSPRLAGAATVLICLLCPAAAHAQLNWQGTGVLSTGGAHAERPDVAMSSGGEAVAAWRASVAEPDRRVPSARRRELRRAGAGHRWRDLQHDNHEVAMGDGGHAQAVWQGDAAIPASPQDLRRVSRRRRRGIRYARSSSRPPERGPSNLAPDTAVDAQGNALSVWESKFNGRAGE